MAQTPEGKVKDKVKRILKKYKCYQFWPVQTGYGAATLDCLGCCNGHFFGIETKAPGKHPTPRQYLTISDMEKARAKVFVIGEYKLGDSVLVGSKNGPPYNKVVTCLETYSGLGELEAWLIMASK